MKLINECHDTVLLDLAKNARKSIKLCAPFVKRPSVKNILDCMDSNVSLSLITSVNLQNFYRNASDISALDMIKRKCGKIYNFQRLHAKIYIFDDAHAIVTSANLTPSGLGRNFEYGILFSDAHMVRQVCDDYTKICSHNDVNEIGEQSIQEITKILSELPEVESIRLPRLSLNSDAECDAVIDKSLLEQATFLSGWQRDLYEMLSILDVQTFSKHEYERIIPELQQRHPTNNTIEAKIRQILQQLRDIGLIKFEGNGVYTKLWK